VRDLITSTANPHVKRIRSLVRSRKERHRERMFVVEGVRLVEEALQFQAPGAILYVPEQLLATPRGRALLNQVEQQPNAIPTTPAILAELSDVETSQGIIAAVPLPQITPTTLTLVLVLDGVQDPGNVGTLLRSAEAAGVDLVVGLVGTADVWSPKVVRAAMGAHFRVPLLDGAEWAAIRPQLAPLTAIYAATQHGPAAPQLAFPRFSRSSVFHVSPTCDCSATVLRPLCDVFYCIFTFPSLYLCLSEEVLKT